MNLNIVIPHNLRAGKYLKRKGCPEKYLSDLVCGHTLNCEVTEDFKKISQALRQCNSCQSEYAKASC